MKRLGKPYLPLVLVLAFIGGIGSTSLTRGLVGNLDRTFFDACSVRLADPSSAPTNGVLVLIDERSLEEIGRRYGARWPWPRAFFAALIASLHQSGAQKIVMDFTFFEMSDPLHDDTLAAYAAACPETILGRTTSKTPVFWTSEFRARFPRFAVDRQTGRVDFAHDDDGVYRRYELPDSLAAKATDRGFSPGLSLLRWYGGLASLSTNTALSAAAFVILGERIQDELQTKGVDQSDPGKVAQGLAALPPLNEPVAKLVRNKVVFVGANAAGAFDIKATPVGKAEPGALVHFTAWANAERNHFVRPISAVVNFGVGAALSVVVVLLGWRYQRPGWIAGLGAVLVAALLAVGFLAFSEGIFFAPFAAIIGVSFALLVSTAHNFWREAGRKREIQAIFGSYVSQRVVETLLNDPDAIRLGGEKKELTVFFSDLAGFTDLSESLAAEDLVRVINWYLAEMTDFVLDNGGYVDKYIGDAIMGVFGSPEPLAHHARAACRAALSCRDHLDKIRAQAPVKINVPLHARIGINTGEMVVGNVGSERKKNFTVLGDAVNLASRLESANKEFDTVILLGENTERLIRGEFVTRPIALLRVKGKTQPNQTHELICEPGKANADEAEFVSAYTAGYDSFLKREFASAREHFHRAQSLRPGDLMTQLYLDKAAGFIELPPPADWDGVLTLKSK